MPRKQWLLVEWVEEDNVFPSYQVVSSNSLVNEDAELRPGKMIFVRIHNANNARKAQILRISDEKLQLKEHKALLERQNHQVKNMVTLCMRTIKEIKPDPLLFDAASHPRASSSFVSAHGMQNGSDNDDDSDDDDVPANKLQVSYKAPTQYKFMDKENDNSPASPASPAAVKSERFSAISSTSLSSCSKRGVSKLTIDQATQTDHNALFPMDKFEQIESILNHLYAKYLNLVKMLQIDCPDNEPNDVKEDEPAAECNEKEAVEVPIVEGAERPCKHWLRI